MSSVLRAAQEIGGPLERFIQVMYYLLPNLEKFNVRNAVVHRVPVTETAILLAFAYAALYATFALLAATFFLKRKEL